MFEGQRLSYLVPGYTGYFHNNTDIFPRKFMKNFSQFKNRKVSQKYLDMQAMFQQSNQKICMVAPLAKQLLM